MKNKTKKPLPKKPLFLVRLNPADILTLIALFFSGYALLEILARHFYLAVSLMFLAMLADAFDGVIARKFGWESELGRYLDGFVDALSYLVNPVLFLYMYGLTDMISLIVFYLFIACGLLRLSKFNITGNMKDGEENKLYYNGLPVFWSHFLLVVFIALSHYLPHGIFIIITDILLLSFSFFMVMNRRFFKPRSYVVMVLAILTIAILFFYLHTIGSTVQTPY